MGPARPVLLNLTGRADLVSAAAGWSDRLIVLTGRTTTPTADIVLIRPDGYVAWAADADTPNADVGMRHALRTWLGAPTEATPI